MHPPFNRAEQALIRKLRTPVQVQKWLRSLPYNWRNDTLWTLRNVVRYETANCIEAAMSAATIMEQHGDPPLLLDLVSQDKLDHVLFLYNHRGRWGTVAKSRDVGLHGRKPVFRSIRDLVYSYVDPYVDGSGRIVGYGVGDLSQLTRVDWRLSEKNVQAVERFLIRMPHKRLRTSYPRYRRMLLRFRRFKARHPDRPFTEYTHRHTWL